MSNESKASLVVDILVEQDGLDVSALMQRKIQARILRAINATENSTVSKCINVVQNAEDVNEMNADTEVKWIDQDEVIEYLLV